MARLRREPVDADELRRAKEYRKGLLILGLEDTHSVAGWLGGQESLLGEVRDLDTTLQRIEAVTVEDIQRLAATIFDDAWLRLAVIGPHRQEAQFERLLTF